MDNYFLGVSNPEDKDTLIKNNVKLLAPKRVIGIHQDFFFLESDYLSQWLLPTVDLVHLQQEIQKLTPATTLIIPERDQLIRLDP